MRTALATPIKSQEFEPGAADDRSFFIVRNDVTGSELYQRSLDMRSWQDMPANDYLGPSSIGYPELRIEDAEGVTNASINVGFEKQAKADDEDDTPPPPVAVWQINARSNDRGYIVQGRIAEDGEEWKLVAADHQGRLHQEGVIEDEATRKQLASFVLGALNKTSVELTAQRLRDEKVITIAQYLAYRSELQQKAQNGFGDKTVSRLLSTCVNTGFTGLGMNKLQHVITPNTTAAPRTLALEGLPAVVKRLLSSKDYKVTVPASKPKALKGSVFTEIA